MRTLISRIPFDRRGLSMSNFSELWSFLRTRKKFWLLPTLIMLLLIGLLIMLASSSAIAPFIYTLF